MTNGEQFDILDVLTILSFVIGYENLMENRQPSVQNDVGAANDRQASYLIDKISERLDAQDMMLKRILSILEPERSEP